MRLMSKPTVTLAFSARAFLAFSNNSRFNILLLIGDYFSDFVVLLGKKSEELIFGSLRGKFMPITKDCLLLGEVAFHAILALYLSRFSLSSLSLSIFLLEDDLL